MSWSEHALLNHISDCRRFGRTARERRQGTETRLEVDAGKRANSSRMQNLCHSPELTLALRVTGRYNSGWRASKTHMTYLGLELERGLMMGAYLKRDCERLPEP